MAFPKGAKHSYETRKKISDALKGRKFSDEHREKIGKQSLGRKHTKKAKRKMSLAKKGKKLTPEHIKNRDASRKGYRHSEETKAKLLKLHLGVHRSAEVRQKMSGANHWNWKGGISSEHIRIRQSVEYKEWRKAVFTRDNYICQICMQRGGTLQADHIKRFADYPKLRFVLSNGRTLCEDCHSTTPTYKNKQKVRT